MGFVIFLICLNEINPWPSQWRFTTSNLLLLINLALNDPIKAPDCHSLLYGSRNLQILKSTLEYTEQSRLRYKFNFLTPELALDLLATTNSTSWLLLSKHE
jgi:hypothetical protein